MKADRCKATKQTIIARIEKMRVYLDMIENCVEQNERTSKMMAITGDAWVHFEQVKKAVKQLDKEEREANGKSSDNRI